MDRDQTIAAMTDIFQHRLDSGPVVEGKWLVWRTTTSTQTLSKFVTRAQKAGVDGVWARTGKVGCLA